MLGCVVYRKELVIHVVELHLGGQLDTHVGWCLIYSVPHNYISVKVLAYRRPLVDTALMLTDPWIVHQLWVIGLLGGNTLLI